MDQTAVTLAAKLRDAYVWLGGITISHSSGYNTQGRRREVLLQLYEAADLLTAQQTALEKAEVGEDDALSQLRLLARGLPEPPNFQRDGGSDWEPWIAWLQSLASRAEAAEATLAQVTQLIAQWRSFPSPPWHPFTANAYNACADELEAALAAVPVTPEG